LRSMKDVHRKVVIFSEKHQVNILIHTQAPRESLKMKGEGGGGGEGRCTL